MRQPFGSLSIESTSALPSAELLALDREKAATYLSLEEALLIDRCLAGDESAFDQLLGRYQHMVYNLALRLLGRREDAMDLAQEVFFQVYRKLGSFRRDASLRTWIYRIVVNRAKNRQRWWRRRQEEFTAVAIDAIDREDWELSVTLERNENGLRPDEVLERKEMGAILQSALAALDVDHRTIIVMKEVEGLSYEEIASALGLALGTVKSRLARARHALKAELERAR